MNKRSAIGIFIFLISAAGIAFGQAADQSQDRAKAKADDADLFPSMTLEIDDLSVEKIEANLPADEPLTGLDRPAPLPGPGEITIEEPAADQFLPDAAAPGAGGKSFFADVVFGAGLQNNLLGGITFYRLGLSPLLKLNFGYENADGFAYRQVGLGYSERKDEFAGTLKLASDTLGFEAGGGFREMERGLQERAGYFSAIDQFSNIDLAFSAKAPELFTFRAAAKAAFTGFSLTGAAAPPYAVNYPPTEYLIGGTVRGELAWPAIRGGLELGYTFRNIPGDASFLVNRFRAGLNASWDVSEFIRAEGNFGVFSSTAVPYLLPWTAGLRWIPFDWLTLNLAGGYRVEEQNLAGVHAAFNYADFPAALPDNYGWYSQAGALVSFANLLLLTADLVLAENANYPHLGPTPDAATGLFPVLYGNEVVTLSLDSRLKLPLFDWLALSGSGRFVLPFTPGNGAVLAFGAGAAAEDPAGAFGASLSLSFKPDLDGQWEFPYLDVSGYVRILGNIKLTVEALDLLQPALGGPRYSPYPYLAPGIRARFKIQITL